MPCLCPPSLAALMVVALVAAGPGAAQQVDLVLPPGADDDLRDILGNASLVVQTLAGDGAAAQDVVAAARADYRQLLTGLYAAGHYGGTISILLDGREASAIQPLDAPARIGRVVIAIDPGPQFRFGAVALAPLPPGTALPPEFATGAPAQSEVVRDAVRAGVLAWRDLGHARAAAAGQDLRANHAAAMLDVAVTLDPGPVLRFGPLEVSGNDRVRTARLREIAGLPEGRTFSPAALDLAATRLRRTGAFQSVALSESGAILPPDLLPILAEVTEMKPRRLGFGAELSSVDGLSLTAFWLHRNLLGGAERFRADAAITGIEGQSGGADAELTLSFGRPATFGPDTDLTAEAALVYLDEPDFRLWQASAQAGLIRHVRDDLTYEAALGIVSARQEDEGRRRDYTLLTLPLSATLDRRPDPFDPVSGYFLDLDITPFLGLAGSDSGGRVLLDARAYRSFGADDRVTLAGRVQAGVVLGADLADTPADFLFYSGGGGTVRGQPYQSLAISRTQDFGDGPEEVRSGGRLFLGTQIEARVQVTGAIEVVGFTDWGLIDADPRPTGDALWHGGVGVGLRYATGIGPIRLDLATPATGPDAGRTLQVYIGIGQSF